MAPAGAASATVSVPPVPPLLDVELLGSPRRLFVHFSYRSRRLLQLSCGGGPVVEAGRLLPRFLNLVVILLLTTLHLGHCLPDFFSSSFDLFVLLLLLFCFLLFNDHYGRGLLLFVLELELKLQHGAPLLLGQPLGGQLALHLRLQKLLLALSRLGLLA